VLNSSTSKFLEADDPLTGFYSGLLIDDSRRQLYVADFSNDKILVYSLSNRQKVTEYPGSDGPQFFLYHSE